jgi:hypothetical protein
MATEYIELSISNLVVTSTMLTNICMRERVLMQATYLFQSSSYFQLGKVGSFEVVVSQSLTICYFSIRIS